MTIIGAICQRVPGSAATVSDPGGGGTPSGTGENELLNSKLSGSESDEADNWGIRFPGEGTVAFAASAVEDHRKVRFTATGPSDRAAIDQDMNVEIGQVYTISCYVVAVDEAATNPSTVILSHAPYGRATIINGTARPTVSSVGPGEWHSYTVEIVSAGTLTIVVGCDNAGDVTVERIMVDPDEDLRTYDATDPTAAPDPVSGLEFLPHHGYGCGTSTAFGDGQFPLRINSNFVGWGIGIPAGIPATAVDYFFTQLRSNRGPAGESNKSRVEGAYPHGAYTWNFKVNCYESNSTFTTVGSLVWTLTDSYTNSMTSDYEGYPVRHFTPPSTWTVEGGEYYILQFENLEDNPDNTYFSLNSSHAQRATTEGMALDPPRAASPSPAYGNSPIVVSGPNSSSVSPYYRGIVGGTGLKLVSGVEIGSSGQDGTGSAMRKAIYGNRKWRQRLTYPWWAQADKLWHGVWKDGTPAGNVTITLSGPNIDESWTRTPAQIPSWNPSTSNLPPRTVETFDLSTWEADEVYTVEISAPSATQTTPYYIGSVRASAPSNQYSDEPVWEQHYPGYPAEYSEDGGSSWLPIGWASEPYAVGNVWVDFAQRVSETEEGLEEPTVAAYYANPFSSESAFHRPVGSGATFSSTAPFAGYASGTVADDNVFSNQSVLATDSHPVANFTWSGALSGVGLPFSIRFPASGFPTYVTDPTYDSAVTVVTDDYLIHDIYKVDTRSGVRKAAIHRTADIRGLGHGTTPGWDGRVGASAAGNVVFAGLIRKTEFETPELTIGHVHHIALPWTSPAYLSNRWQAPAVCHDGFAETNSPSAPCNMGDLLAIRSSDLAAVLAAINSMAVSDTAKEMLGRYATAFCQYGVLVTDSAGQISFRADGVLDVTLKAAFVSFIRTILWTYLRRVTNSITGSPGTITTGAVLTGDGGTLTWPAGGGSALADNTALDA